MNNLKKIISALLVLIMLISIQLSLISCDDAEGGGESAGEGEGESNEAGAESGKNPEEEPEEESTPVTLEEINAYRTAQRQEQLAALSDKLGEQTVAVLCDIYELYDENLYIWLANLYDSNIQGADYTVLDEAVRVGGFYYSNSARDNTAYLWQKFLPDIESTVQALHLLENSGLASSFGGSWTNMFSEGINEELLNFAWSLQSYTDGNFYHPQWGTNINSSRRGRDRGWAIRLIQALGEKPIFDSPNGVSGYYRIGANPAASLDMQLGASTAVAVSKIIPTVASEFSSEENFRKWLDSLGINKDSYEAGNILDSRSGEISAAGLMPYLRDYLREKQYDNGLWEEEISYNAINGLMKISPRFVVSDPFPKPEAAIDSIMTLLDGEIENGMEATLSQIQTICYVYNPWVAMRDIISFLRYEDQLAIESEIFERAPELLGNVLDKLKLFKKDDGGFSYYQGMSSPYSQGELVAAIGKKESDVNATAIAISTVFKQILPIYGIKLGSAPDLYTKYDALYFISIIEEEYSGS